ncbi:MAG TPA: malto-oligosyltrehalose trehalohydrolase [Ohtaekwangia sp.]|nr:malto-oligosyltrehalose trehalohydrolase [Ohtaekwangia sp.]
MTTASNNTTERFILSNPVGTTLISPGVCHFKVWAPLKDNIVLHLFDPDEKIPLTKDKEGYFTVTLHNIAAGRKYCYNIDGAEGVPDPASYHQPDGVHGPSQVVDHNRYQWNDDQWKGIPFKDLILYEIHVGTFTAAGTFEAVIPCLDDLVDVGINAIEIMPVSQFPGNRNWGYDGVFPYAVQNTYGGQEGLKKLVDACHQKGIAVFLDVVYNHVGPEGNYLSLYGPYFTNTYCTPWGDAINFDGAWSDAVKEYFCNNALYWFQCFHIDGLRIDAVHMVFDNSAVNVWEHLHEKMTVLQEKTGRPLHLIAESDLNNPKVIRDPASGGYGFRAQWLDDFHHALYVMLDFNGRERYIDFGRMEQLAKAYTDGFVHSGEYVKFRRRKHGVSSAGVSGDKFVVFILNHDQAGNRPMGERLSMLVDFDRLKLAAAAMLLSPYVPMLFMGEEYGEQSPFFYFVSHSDKKLIEAVRKGRKEEFKDFNTNGESPDPQDEKTFNDSKLKWHLRKEGQHFVLRNWYKELISLRKKIPALQNFSKNDTRTQIIGQSGLILLRCEEGGKSPMVCLFNFSEKELDVSIPFYGKRWIKILDSSDAMYQPVKSKTKGVPSEVLLHEIFTLPAVCVCVFVAGF